MRYVSLCSGVEATTVAWSKLGWEPLAFSEIDPFACAVLAHRFPGVPNLGDMMEVDWKEFHERNGIIDVLFASTPCQSFSIAGNRLGLDGESGLMWGFVRAVRDLVAASGGASPRYIVWENVPGCLSSGPKGQKGSDFRCLLEALVECGYGVSWRVLDSQFARVLDRSGGRLEGPVPQRRRRVYLVGSLGTDGSAEILFERTCLSGDYPKGRNTRKELAEDIEGCPGMGDLRGMTETLTPWDVQSKRVNTPYGTSPTLPSGTGEGMNIQPVVMTTANMGNANGGNVSPNCVTYTLDGTNSNAVAYCMGSVRQKAPIDSETSGTLDAGHEQPIVVMDRAAFNQGENAQYSPHIEQADFMDTLVARGPHAVCYREGNMPDGNGQMIDGNQFVVRRLMPVECERLQGFPDGWTDLAGCDVDAVIDRVSAALGLEHGGEEYEALLRKVRKWSAETPDTPRYKAMGNSITTYAIEIVGRRIQAFDELHYDEIGL